MSDLSPLDDANADQASVAVDKRPFPKHWIALGLLVIANAALGAYFHPMNRDIYDSEKVLFAILGFLLAQPILFALWAAFAPQRFYHRLLWAFLLCTLVSFLEELGALGNTKSGLGTTMMFQLILFVLFTAILLLVRQFIGWHFKISQMGISPGDYQSYQFGVKHLILLTTFAAIAFALIRSLFILDSNNNWVPAVGIHCIIFAMIIPIIIVPWFTMGLRGNTIKLIVFATVLLGIIDSAIFLIALKADAKHIDNNLQAILLLQLGACLTVMFNTIVLRLCGYRLMREKTV